MTTGETIAALLVGGVGVYALARLLRPRTPEAKPAAPSDGVCGSLKPLGVEYATLCGVGAALLDSLGRESEPEALAANIAANGPIVGKGIDIDPRFHEFGQGYVQQGTSNDDQYHVSPAFKGRSVPKHANGCVPLSGDPRFKLCAPGTHKLNHFAQAGSGYAWDPGRRQGDTLTHPHYNITGDQRSHPFPLPCPKPSQSWWLSGKPVCVPPGYTMHRTINEDGSVSVRAMAPVGPPPPQGQQGTAGSNTDRAICEATGIRTGAWVRDPGATFCRRIRVGE